MWWAVAVASLGTAFVAVTAFVLAYGGSKGAALDAGISGRAAGWYPFCIEGVIVVASIATVVLPRGERRLGWLVLLAFTAVSAAANVLHAIDHDGARWWSPGFAVVPPLALPICVRILERVALSLPGRRASVPLVLPAPVSPNVAPANPAAENPPDLAARSAAKPGSQRRQRSAVDRATEAALTLEDEAAGLPGRAALAKAARVSTGTAGEALARLRRERDGVPR